MAKILPFAKGGAERSRRPGERKADGEVVIFPGVRVEYHEDPPPPKAKRRHRHASRRAAKDAISA